MAIVSKDKERLAVALELAEADFWTSIGESYPEAKTGDLSPSRAIELSTVMEKSILEWLVFNVDSVDVEHVKTTEIMLHRIEYSYRNRDLELTDSDEEHIAYCISQGISSGELCTVPFGKGGEVYGWWEINNNPT